MEYEIAIVSFIDILGFKTIVEHRSPGVVSMILDIFGLHMGKASGYDKTNRTVTKTTVFSDSILRSSRKINSPLGTIFAKEMEEIANAQAILLRRNVLIRGGLTIGKIIHNVGDSGGSKVYGPGVNRAYYLESQIARTPRIVIDPDILTQYSEITESCLLSFDDDGIPWINYFDDENLNPVYRMDDQCLIEGITISGLENIMYEIKSGLNNQDLGIRGKYAWTATQLRRTWEQNPLTQPLNERW